MHFHLYIIHYHMNRKKYLLILLQSILYIVHLYHLKKIQLYIH
nr:MAG TPA: hypothetical protein [Caudoviricetes sp.]